MQREGAPDWQPAPVREWLRTGRGPAAAHAPGLAQLFLSSGVADDCDDAPGESGGGAAAAEGRRQGRGVVHDGQIVELGYRRVDGAPPRMTVTHRAVKTPGNKELRP